MNKIIETVALIHIKNKKLLLVRPKSKKIFYMPGGKLDDGEDNLKALIREIKEEVKLDIDPKTVDFYGTFEAQAYGKDKGVIVRVHCYTASHTGNVQSSSEIDETAYFSHEEYVKGLDPAPAVKLILEDLKKKGLVE
ncbi:Mismatch repair protein MutT protein [Candidatus Roizmanbacteria bacterium]|mgnify:CR=1 FL=1|nr:Mismatch repair protein MutT protein [Candidatus Roizmanbacteria bacterium]